MERTGIVIAGGGTIGLSLALELRTRGAEVTVLDAGNPGLASTAAAGMLAAHDPENPIALHPLSELALQLYPAYLKRIAELGGEEVVLQTRFTLQQSHLPLAKATMSSKEIRSIFPGSTLSDDFYLLEENSLDPRALHRALQRAVLAAGVQVLPDTAVTTVVEQSTAVEVQTTRERIFTASTFVDCTGAWSFTNPRAIQPVKGQMLRLRLEGAPLYNERTGNVVLRTPEIYIVPRLDGTALVGATVEHGAGFDLHTSEEALIHLQQLAAAQLPTAAYASRVEAWAGLRPRAVQDDLPLLGAVSSKHFLATAHFRNGILLAPATASVLADVIAGQSPSVDIAAFSPSRIQST